MKSLFRRKVTHHNQSTEEKIAELFRQKRMTLAIAESCTGGLISHRITNIPGSSKFFKGGVVAYSNEMKTSILGVSRKAIRDHGAASSDIAHAMAEGAKRVLKSDIAMAITGIAGPTGGTDKKPVGLAFMAFSGRKTVRIHKILFKGNRVTTKKRFSDAALKFILENTAGVSKK